LDLRRRRARALLADGPGALGFLLQPQRLHLVRVGAKLGNGLLFGTQYGVVIVPLGGSQVIARRGLGLIGVDGGLLGRLQRSLPGCQRILAISRVDGW